MKFLCDKLLPAAFWILIMLAFDSPFMAIATALAAALHEIGHIIILFILEKDEIPLPRAALSGLRLKPTRILSYGEELLLAIGGPLLNLLIFLIIFALKGSGGYLYLFAVINLLTALSNLIPISGNDGYRIASSALGFFLSEERCDGIMTGISSATAALFLLLSLFFILKLNEGYWIFAIFFAVFIKDFFKIQNATNLKIKRDFERFREI